MKLEPYLVFSALLFSIGAFGVLTRRNAVGILMALELMLNAVNVNLVAFARFVDHSQVVGQIFTLFIITVAAAEAAVGLAIIICIYRNFRHINLDDVDLLKW
ncbi:MAG TPA: NADH-quinone oxidoreductase subunit NuoK [Armatimonadetes bacterium]|nr:NADH-quinone oxidoreductase subunit NuoK [Armatimonadota bacterium]